MYLAPVSMYVHLYAGTRMLIDLDAPFVKQTFRNRALIAAENGALPLTVPVVHSGGARQAMRDVRISDHGNWRRMHWNAIVSAYKKSPFFDYYADDFRPFYEKRYDFLVDFNMQLHDTVCGLLGLERETAALGSVENSGHNIDVRPLAEPSAETAAVITTGEPILALRPPAPIIPPKLAKAVAAIAIPSARQRKPPGKAELAVKDALPPFATTVRRVPRQTAAFPAEALLWYIPPTTTLKISTIPERAFATERSSVT